MSSLSITLLTLTILSILGHFGLFKPNKPLLPIKNCGISFLEPIFADISLNFSKNIKIIHGSEVKPNSFPWIVSLRANKYRNVHFCGGVIISQLYIIT